jgi:antitoxin CptB
MPEERPYMAAMPSEAELKRLHWRAHHRGTREADMLIGGFFDANHASWSAGERLLFERMLEQQDVDIMAWAHGTAEAPERFAGPMIEALKKLDYIRIAR